MEKIPLLVAGLSLIAILKPDMSEVTCHWIPRALSISMWSKSKSLTAATQSDSEMYSKTLDEFDSHLLRRKPQNVQDGHQMARMKLSLSFNYFILNSSQWDNQCHALQRGHVRLSLLRFSCCGAASIPIWVWWFKQWLGSCFSNLQELLGCPVWHFQSWGVWQWKPLR